MISLARFCTAAVLLLLTACGTTVPPALVQVTPPPVGTSAAATAITAFAPLATYSRNVALEIAESFRDQLVNGRVVAPTSYCNGSVSAPSGITFGSASCSNPNIAVINFTLSSALSKTCKVAGSKVSVTVPSGASGKISVDFTGVNVDVGPPPTASGYIVLSLSLNATGVSDGTTTGDLVVQGVTLTMGLLGSGSFGGTETSPVLTSADGSSNYFVSFAGAYIPLSAIGVYSNFTCK